MYWSLNTIEKATRWTVTGLKGRECYVCVVCGMDIASNGAKVMNVDSWDDEGFRVFTTAPLEGDSKIETSIPCGGFAHIKCFNAKAVEVRLRGKSFHASNGRYVNKSEYDN